jgi:pimeloyl-ACP methyl ester carboxylesterase
MESPLVLGHSIGCQVAVELAVQSPSRVGSLVLLGPTMDPGAPRMRDQLGRLVRDIVREPLGLNLVESRDYLRMGPLRILTTARLALADPFESKLGRVQQPTLVLRGERDPIVSERWAKRIVELLPSARYGVIGGAAHAAHWGAADEVTRVVEEFQHGLGEVPWPLHHRNVTDVGQHDQT